MQSAVFGGVFSFTSGKKKACGKTLCERLFVKSNNHWDLHCCVTLADSFVKHEDLSELLGFTTTAICLSACLSSNPSTPFRAIFDLMSNYPTFDTSTFAPGSRSIIRLVRWERKSLFLIEHLLYVMIYGWYLGQVRAIGGVAGSGGSLRHG